MTVRSVIVHFVLINLVACAIVILFIIDEHTHLMLDLAAS